MIWNNQDTNLSWYVPKANVDHTISGQGTAVSTLDHSATTPREISLPYVTHAMPLLTSTLTPALVFKGLSKMLHVEYKRKSVTRVGEGYQEHPHPHGNE